MMRLRALLLLALLVAPSVFAQNVPPRAAALGVATEATLFVEEFGRTASLAERGWRVETIAGPRAAFHVAAGNATIADERGAYPQRLDARLVSPELDLRSLAGVPIGNTSQSPRVAREALDAGENATRPAAQNASQPGAGLTWTPRDPARAQADVDGPRLLQEVDERLVWPPGANLTEGRVDPVVAKPNVTRLDAPAAQAQPAFPDGAGKINLTIRHAWAFAPGDGLSLEIRTRPDAATPWSDWTPLAPREPLEGNASAGYSGALPDATPAFIGASGGPRTTEVALEAYAGALVQVAFHARADAPLPPDDFGYKLDEVTLRALLGAADVGIEGFGPATPNATLALDAWWTPTAYVRNWGAHPMLGVHVRVELFVEGQLARGGSLNATLDLAPGERVGIALPTQRFPSAQNLTLVAQLVPDAGTFRADARPGNDRATVSLRAGNVADLRISLAGEAASAVTASGDPKKLHVEVANQGNVATQGTLGLWATRTDVPAPAQLVASVPVAVGGAATSFHDAALLDADPANVELAWAPTQRGAYILEARLGTARSNLLSTYVDLAPPPVLEQSFALPSNATRPYPAGSADALAGWGFESWSLTESGAPIHDAPAAAGPRSMLVARAADDTGAAEGAIVAGEARSADATADETFVLALPAPPIDGPIVDETNASASQDVNLSYARVLGIAREAGCACEDPATRVLALAPLVGASIVDESLTVAKNRTTVSFGEGGVGWFYVVLDARVDPGVEAWYAPLVASRAEGDAATLLPPGRLRPYDDDGVRCCIVGPYHAEDVAMLAASSAAAPPVVDRVRTHREHSTARDLSDLLSSATPGGTYALALEHRAAFAWRNGTGARGFVDLERVGALPGDAPARRIAIENATRGWETIEIPLDAEVLATPHRLRLTLEAVGNTTEAFADCPYLNATATCDAEPLWRVDALRLIDRNLGRALAVDDLDEEARAHRWNADGAAGLPTAAARGWSLETTAKDAPHRFALADAGVRRDAEPNATRALRWGEPASMRLAASAPTWSVARTSWVDLSGLAAPVLTMRTRYDFGSEQNGTFAAGGAIVAIVENDVGQQRRILLVPQTAEGGGYRGDVSAPAFDPLARALRIEIPRGTTATAIVGASDWTPLRIDLAPLGNARRVAFELHAVSARPLATLGWVVDDLRIGEPGPAHDLALEGFPSLPQGVGLGRGVPATLAVNLSNAGLMRAGETRVDVEVRNAKGGLAYGPASLTLPQGPIERAVLSFPEPWTPTEDGRYRVVAHVTSTPADERAENDWLLREVVVADRVAASIDPASHGIGAGLSPGIPATLQLRVRNEGTLPLDAARPATLGVQVYDGATPLLAEPSRADVATLAGRAVAPGESVELRMPRAWTPTTSGLYRIEAWITTADQPEPPARLSWPIRVERALDTALVNATREGAGWTNATGAANAAWTFRATPNVEGNLSITPPLNLRNAMVASLELTHAYDLEEGFDAGALEAQVPDGRWIALPATDGTHAFTGTSAIRTDRFDLGAIPQLREPVTLATPLPGGVSPEERWSGPALRDAWRASTQPAPTSLAPADATAHERRDTLRFGLGLPSAGRGDLVVGFQDWRALGLHGDPDVPESAIAAYVVLPDGARIQAAEPIAIPERREDWTARELVFPLTSAWPRSATLVFEHQEIAARAGSAFESGTSLAHGGWAVGQVSATLRDASSSTEVALGASPAIGADAWWLTPRGRIEAPAPQPAFAPLAAESVWHDDEGAWVAAAGVATFPDARLVLPVDLRPAAQVARVVVRATTLLSNASSFALDVSTDEGRTWAAAELLASPGHGGLVFNASPYAGRTILVGLHAAFGTTQAARDDTIRIDGIHIEAEILRGDVIPLRLRASADADGKDGTWEIMKLDAKIIEHGRGLGLRLVGPGGGPLTQGFRTLDVEVLNRGPSRTSATRLAVSVTEPSSSLGEPDAVHEASRAIPPLAPGASVSIPVRGADLNWYLAAGENASRVQLALAPATDEAFIADNVLDARVGGENVQVRSTLAPVRLNVTPQSIDVLSPNRTVTFTATVRNTGEDAALLGPSTLRLWKDGVNVRNLTGARPSNGRLAPGEEIEVAWTWKPANDTASGGYAAEANIVTSTARGSEVRTLNATLLVGPYFPTFARVDRLDAREGWSCVATPACMREDFANRSAPSSLAVGLPGAGVGRAVVESPEFPINASVGAWVRAYARHALLPAERVHVSAAVVLQNGSGGAWQTLGALEGRSAGYDEGRFAEVLFDATALLPPLDARGMRIRFDAPIPAAGGAPALLVDDVSVSAIEAAWIVPSPVVLADGVEKRMNVTFENRGGVTDTYAFRFEDALGRPTSLPAGWSARLVDPLTGRTLAVPGANVTARLALAADGARNLTLVVRSAPTGAGAPLRGPVPIALTAQSTLLPDLARSVTVDIRSRGLARADLAVVGLDVRATDTTVGRARTVEVTIANRGLAAATVALDLTAYPPGDVLESPEPLRATEGASSLRLGPGASRTVAFLWTPRHSGDYRLEAILDAARTQREPDVADNVLTRSFGVTAAPFPDLRVELVLDDPAPLLGVPVPLAVRVANGGNAPARGVEVALRAGAVDAMPGGSPRAVGDLAPGASWWLNTTWAPEIPGEVRLLATAFARGGLAERVETLDDNARVLAVIVREPSAKLERLAQQPGLRFRLTNGGNAEETYELDAQLPSGWLAATDVNNATAATATLRPGESANVTLRVLPPSDALAGNQSVWLLATSRETGQRQRVEASVPIPAQRELRVMLLPREVDPKEATLVVDVVNDGNAVERITFDALRLPPSWKLVGTVADVPPRTRTTIELQLAIPDAPTVSSVQLGWRGAKQNGTVEIAARVAERHALDAALGGAAVAGGEGALSLRLTNAGNVVAAGTLRLDLPEGAASDLEGRAFSLRPGETREIEGAIYVAEDAPDTIRIGASTEGNVRASAHARLDVARADLAIVDWTTPDAARAAESGRHRASIANVGGLPLPGVVVELFANGALVAYDELGELAPGAEADAVLVWAPQAGLQTWTLRARSTSALADADPTNDALARTLDVPDDATPLIPAAARATPAPAAIMLVALVLVALAFGRRRA